MNYNKRTIIYDNVFVSHSTEHSSWNNMLSRCKDKYSEGQYYKEKGITVCDRWTGKDGFMNFYKDMGRKPTPQHSIDRKCGEKGYSPENCRWATKSQQAINRRLSNRNTSGYRGVSWYKLTNRWVVATNKKNIGYFLNKDEAARAYNSAAVRFFGDDAILNKVGG